jgi:hypothetical protein
MSQINLEETTMNPIFIITVYVVFDQMSDTFLGKVKYQPKMTPAEIMTVAVVAARYFNNNLERGLLMMREAGYIPAPRCLSVSRFNRQLHRCASFFGFCLQTLMELARGGEVFIIDSEPVPVCKRKRARRCRKVRGRLFCGYCAAKDEKFFGWRLHLVCTPDGVPASFTLLPGALHDLTPIYELTYDFPAGATFYGDKGYNSGPDETELQTYELRLIPIRKKNMTPHTLWDEYLLDQYRKGIETVNSQLESMGLQRLRARTNEGFEIKVHSSLLALYHTQLMAHTN